MSTRIRRFVVSASLALWATTLAADIAPAQPTGDGQSSGGRTQGGARVTFSSLEDWNLKGENLSPRGHNPLFFPLEPGFRYILENPDHAWGHFRLEVIVLDETEPFDVPGIGKFDCAVVQEEEFFDGILHERSHNWFSVDEASNNVYEFGEVSWEVDERGRKVFAGSWRVGEPDGNGIAEPGLQMPGAFEVGARYLFEGHEAEAYGYTENLAKGIVAVTPAGTFEDCVRAREHSLINPALLIDKVWCEGVGVVSDSADGLLVASDAVPATKEQLASFGKLHENPVKVIEPPVAKIDGLEATEIARKKVPGRANSVKVERLGRRNVYAVEIISAEDGTEWDVFVDIETGEVVGTDR